MKSSLLSSAALNSHTPVLIVDKKGVLTRLLLPKISDQAQLVIASSQNISGTNRRVLFVPFLKRVPRLPDIVYSALLIIWDGEKELKSALPEFIKKAQEDKANLIFAVHISLSTEPLVKKFFDSSNRVILVVYGDIFGEEISSDSPLLVNRFLQQAWESHRLEVLNQGLDYAYPILADEASSGIVDLVNRRVHGSRIYYIFPKHPPTQLRLAHMIQKTDPLVRIDFVDRKRNINYDFPKGGEYLVDNAYDLSRSLRRIYEQGVPVARHAEVVGVRRHRPIRGYQQEKKSFSRVILFLSLFIVSLLCLPLGSVLAFSFVGARNLLEAGKNIERGNIDKAVVYADTSAKQLGYAYFVSQAVVTQASFVGLKSQAELTRQRIGEAQEASLAFASLLDSLNRYKAIIDEKNPYAREDIASVINSIKQAYVAFHKVKIQTDSPEDTRLFAHVPFLTTFVNRWQSIKIPTEHLGGILEVAPSVLGFEGKRVYLVLFQNNMELRPGGGFIGSYGLATMEGGRLTQLTLNNIYDADGQLKGHVEPPFPIRRYLPSVHWYLRDSNFDVDFTRAASSSANLFLLETGEMVDGVIGIDTTFLSNIIKHVDPIFIPQYGETITAENMYKILQERAEKDSFAGSRQKQEFIAAVFESAQHKFLSASRLPYLDLFKTFEEMTAQKHLLFAFSNPAIQRPFTIGSLSSSTLDFREKREDVVLDFLGINEANLGVNKANYLIKRKVDHEVNLTQGETISGKVTISYANLNTDWPGGDYKNYLRIILPLGATLTDVSIDAKPQEITKAITNPKIYEAKRFSPPTKLEVDRVDSDINTSYGFLVLVAKGGYKTIEISYSLGKSPALSSAFTYDLWYFKQPGTEPYPFSVRVVYPDTLKPDLITNGQVQDKDSVFFSTVVSTDERLRLKFVEK